MTTNTTALTAVAIASNGRYLLVCGPSHLHVVDARTGSLCDVRDDTSHGVPRASEAAISSDGRLIATADGPKNVTLWDADTGTRRWRLDGRLPTSGRGAFSADSEYLLTRDGQTVWLWSCATGERLASFRSLESVIRVAISSDARRIAATGGHCLVVWDRYSGSKHQWPELGASDPTNPGGSNPWELAISADGQHALTADVNGIARLWDTSTGAEVRRYDTGRRPRAVPTRTYYRTSEGRVEHVESMRGVSSTMSVALSADGRTVVTAHADEVRLWDGQTGQLARRFECSLSSEHVSDIALSPDARTLLILDGGRAFVMDMETGALVPVPPPN